MPKPASPVIVMVHGAFCGGWAFDRFRTPFEAAGWRVVAPDLRGHAADERPEALNSVSMSDYAADIAALIRGLDAPPVLLGHSMGGLVAQLASRLAPVSALALLAPSPPWGVAGSSLQEAMAAFGVQMINPFAPGVVPADREVMRAYALEHMTPADAEWVLNRLRPESGQALRETLNWWLDPFMTTSIGSGPLATPALVLGGGSDHVHPAATVRQTAERIGAEFELLPKMSHWLVGEPGWEAAARRVIGWLDETARAAA